MSEVIYGCSLMKVDYIFLFKGSTFTIENISKLVAVQKQVIYMLILIIMFNVILYTLKIDFQRQILFNPISTRLCHVIYCHSDKSYPCLFGIGFKDLSLYLFTKLNSIMIFVQNSNQNKNAILALLFERRQPIFLIHSLK